MHMSELKFRLTEKKPCLDGSFSTLSVLSYNRSRSEILGKNFNNNFKKIHIENQVITVSGKLNNVNKFCP